MVIFSNQGIIEPRSIFTFGVSVKEGSNPIGFFGTGLKYAIAIILREKCKIEIRSGKATYKFGLKREKVRGKDFAIVTCNGKELGFTTELGKTWELWKAYRELYCNMLDEKGHIGIQQEDRTDCLTAIYVTGKAFDEIHKDSDKFILKTPALKTVEGIFGGTDLSIHPGESKAVFYHGNRVHESDKPSVLTYNIKASIDLTEDRTARYSFQVRNQIADAIARSDDEAIIEKVLTAGKDTFEGGFDFGHTTPSPAFISVVQKHAQLFTGSLNKSALERCRFQIMDQLEHGAHMTMTDIESQQLEKARAFCEFLGFNVWEVPVICTDFLGELTLGLAKNRKIYIARRAFQMGTKQVAVTLIEEYLHIKYGLDDESRSMQNFLFDQIATIGERLKGEPL